MTEHSRKFTILTFTLSKSLWTFSPVSNYVSFCGGNEGEGNDIKTHIVHIFCTVLQITAWNDTTKQNKNI